MITVRHEVMVSVPTGGGLMTLGQLREMLAHPTVAALGNDYEVLINKGAHGNSLRLMQSLIDPETKRRIATVENVISGGWTLETSIEAMDLSVRTFNCLTREGLTTVEHLIRKSSDQLLSLRNFNERSIIEVETKLAEHGLALRPSDPPLPPHLAAEDLIHHITDEQ